MLPHLPAALCLATALLSGLPATAGPVTDTAAVVESLAGGSDPAALDAAIEALNDAVWQSTGLYIRTVALVDEPASGYGLFNARDTNVYAVGEPVVVYAEPKGFSYGDVAEGVFQIAFDADLTVIAGDGTVLADVPDILALELTTRLHNREFHANLTYNL